MNQVLIDNSLLALAALAAVLLVRFSPARTGGAVFSFFLLFPPLVVFANMWAHTVAVAIVNFQRYAAGTFQYSFTVYSLLLFGVVFIVLSGMNLHYSRRYMEGVLRHKRTILWLNGATALGFLPVVFLNPLGALPVIASVVSTIAVLAGNPVRRRQEVVVPAAEAAEEVELLF